MRTLLYLLSAMAVIGLAFWAYQENYQTKAAIETSDHLQRKIADARSKLAMMKAEWAYQNRPDRLRALAEMNYKDLQLQPIDPSQFGSVDQVPYPKPSADPKPPQEVEMSSLLDSDLKP
ncbi:cell division protein FtsL [Pseudooceanicola sp. CBS1P-1]|uniref:Cell division protein FtsL n=1 Tax=Pseudooceanicola albus TaxID=2692189 RepID=A0A6L7G6E9_9RHOB|nr:MULTISPECIES: cell division protein FtsL [Pseudooceanicola]MBT9383064.1 cell division protein FtsL [Pseudooceanicola endophyticus]MXN19252.1 cell division protein FtsL [Pseudooceanicola albus]